MESAGGGEAALEKEPVFPGERPDLAVLTDVVKICFSGSKKPSLCYQRAGADPAMSLLPVGLSYLQFACEVRNWAGL